MFVIKHEVEVHHLEVGLRKRLRQRVAQVNDSTLASVRARACVFKAKDSYQSQEQTGLNFVYMIQLIIASPTSR